MNMNVFLLGGAIVLLILVAGCPSPLDSASVSPSPDENCSAGVSVTTLDTIHANDLNSPFIVQKTVTTKTCFRKSVVDANGVPLSYVYSICTEQKKDANTFASIGGQTLC